MFVRNLGAYNIQSYKTVSPALGSQVEDRQERVYQKQIVKELITYWCFLIDWFDNKFLIIERNISYVTPGESYFWSQSVKKWKYTYQRK